MCLLNHPRADSRKQLSWYLLKNKMEVRELGEEGPKVDLVGLGIWKMDELAVLPEEARKSVATGLECNSIHSVV